MRFVILELIVKYLILALVLALLPKLAKAEGPTCVRLFNDTFELFPVKTEELVSEGINFNQKVVQKNGKLFKQTNTTEEAFEAQYQNLNSTLATFFKIAPRTVENIELKQNEIVNSKMSKAEGTKILFELEKIDKNLELMASGVISRITEFLNLRGINYELVPKEDSKTYNIVISTKGSHYLNKIAAGAFKKYRVQLLFDVLTLVERRNGGAFDAVNDKPKIYLDPTIILERSMLHNPTALHEYIHNITYWEIMKGKKKPYHIRIATKVAPKEVLEKLGVYSQFSVDEIKAYRMSIRAMIHNALMYNAGDAAYLSAYVKDLLAEVRLQVTFSEVTNKILTKHKQNLMANKTWLSPLKNLVNSKAKIFTVEISKDEIYEVNAREDAIDGAIEMSRFTYGAYDLIAKRLEDVQNKSPEEQILALKQVAQVLSLRSLKDLDGNYPNIDKVSQLLTENKD